MIESVEIIQVANGYIVRPTMQDRMCVISWDSTNVFQSFIELTNWLDNHFSHREKELLVDG